MPVDKKLVESRGFQISRLYSGGPYRLAPVVDSYGEPLDVSRAGFANIQKGKRELGESPRNGTATRKTLTTAESYN